MEDRLDLKIYDQLVRYLAGQTTLRAFRDWFDASTWDMARQGASHDAYRIAGEVELRLAEFSNGHWTEHELRAKLLPLVVTFAQRDQLWGDSAAWYFTCSGNVTLSQEASLGSPVGITASVVSG